VPAGLRRPLVIGASIAGGIAGTVWLLSWTPVALPSSLTGVAVAMAFPLIFVGMAAVIYEQGGFTGSRNRRRGVPVPGGWKRLVLAAALGLVLVSFLTVGGERVREEGGRYYRTEFDDRRIEISASDYQDQHARSSRPFAAGIVFFACFVLVTLTTDRDEEERQRTARLARSADEWRPRHDRFGRAHGSWYVVGEAPGDADQVIDRLRLVVPVAVAAGGTTSRRITADWWASGLALDRTTKDLFMVGTIEQTLHGTSRVQLEVRSSGPGWMVPRRSKVVALLTGLLFVLAAIGAAALTVSPAIAFLSVLILIWSANLAMAMWSTSIAIRRGARSVAAALGLPSS
jgi:hypothetical protein